MNILDMLFPQICSICGKPNQESLCNRCRKILEKEFEFKTDNYEANIGKNFKEHSYCFKYQEEIRNQIIDYKFQEKPYIYKTISNFLRKNQKSLEKLKKYDIIIPVPISKKRYKERGYNQSELIAKEIGKIIQVEVETKCLYKNKDIQAQSTLNKEQREENIKDVYTVKNIEKIKDKNILIFDDIYTTGSTVNECAKALIEKGIEKSQIGVLTIAKD